MRKAFRRKEERIPYTRVGYDNLLIEHQKLLQERPDAVENLRKAREMGDLSENGYYKAARARLSFLDARIRRSERLIRLGIVVKPADTGKIEIGCRVKFSDGKHIYEYTIVGGYESDPSKQTISHVSPIGMAMLGKKIHDSIEVPVPSGRVKYSIVEIGLPSDS